MNLCKKITFLRFSIASASMLQEGLELPTEKLICLYKECIEMAKHCNDVTSMMGSCMEFVSLSDSIGRHADSLKCLKEILPSAVVIPSFELTVHRCLSFTYNGLEEFDNVVLHAKKWVEIARNIGDKEKEMCGHYVMGNALLSLACYDEAFDNFKKSLEIAKQTDCTKGEVVVYYSLTIAYVNMHKYDDTILYAHKLLDCAMKTNDKKAIGTAYLHLGTANLALNHYQDATDCGEKCIEITKEIQDRDGEVGAYLLMGQIYKVLSDYDNGILYCKKCIDLAVSIGNKRVETNAYRMLGEIYYSLGKYDDAISNCNKCVHTHKKDDEDDVADAFAYLTLGKVSESLEKYDEAIRNFKHSIDIVNRIGRRGKERISVDARACLHLGKIYKTLEQYDDAVQYSKKCIDMAQQAESKIYQMEGHLLLAQIYFDTMQLNDMSLSIDAGMEIAIELGDKKTEENFKALRSVLYLTVGLLDKENTRDSVKELFEASICSEDDLFKDLAQAARTGDKMQKHIAYYRLYTFYLSKKDYKKAINCLEQLKGMNLDRSVNLFCLTEIGDLYQLIGQNDMALRCYKEGLPTVECSSHNRQRSIFYYGIGKLFLLNEKLNRAEHYLREAIRCFEAIFTKLGSRDEFKISIFDKYIHSYKLLVILLIKGERLDETLVVLDRCRARALKDLLISNFKLEREKSNEEHLEHNDVFSVVSKRDYSISYYSLCFDAFLTHYLGETDSHFSGYSNHSLQIYVDTLLDEMGVREVVNCEDRSLDKEQDIQKEQKTSEEEYEVLNQQTASLLNLDSKRGELNENSAETKRSTPEVLFHILECDKILSSTQDEVVIIPEGPLYKVPFSALRDPLTGKYLSETKRIRLAPSLATLWALQQSSAYHDITKGALIIGDPLVGKVMFDGEEKEFDPLIDAFCEALAVASFFHVTPLTRQTATKPAVIQRLKQGVAVVHIAAHGSLTKGTIALAPSPEIRATKIPDEEDYMLTMADVQQARVRAQLVVLSCCHSGRGEIRAEGVVGMCRAFLASGASAVVASLWAIEDEATLEFMCKFYLSLREGKSASASLQQAMEDMRNTTSYSKPKYWAPFFLIGDDVTIKF